MSTKWVHFRINDELHERIRAAAAADRRSLSNWVSLTIERVFEEARNDQAEQSAPSPHGQEMH